MTMDNSLCFLEFQQALDFVDMNEQTRLQITEAVFQTFCVELSKKNKLKPSHTTMVLRDAVLARQFKKTERRAVRLYRQIHAIREDIGVFREKMGKVDDICTMRVLRADLKYRCNELEICRDKLRLDQEFMISVSHDTSMLEDTSSSSSDY